MSEDDTRRNAVFGQGARRGKRCRRAGNAPPYRSCTGKKINVVVKPGRLSIVTGIFASDAAQPACCLIEMLIRRVGGEERLAIDRPRLGRFKKMKTCLVVDDTSVIRKRHRSYRPRAACRRQRVHHEAVRQGHRDGKVPGSRTDRGTGVRPVLLFCCVCFREATRDTARL